MNKENIKKAFLLLILTFFLSCQKQEKLIGKWERFGDKMAGMQIQVTKEGESFKASICFLTDSAKVSGFAVGDVKWKNIKVLNEKKYELEDLMKTPYGFTNYFTSQYDLTNLEMISDDEIYTRVFSKGTELVGTEQHWKRIVE